MQNLFRRRAKCQGTSLEPVTKQFTSNVDCKPTTFPPRCHPKERSDEGSAVASMTLKCSENPKSSLLPHRRLSNRLTAYERVDLLH
jgi:hypothetical protein